MKFIFSVLIFQLLLSCNDSSNSSSIKVTVDTAKVTSEKKLPDQDFSINPTKILKDYDTWYRYSYNNVHLSQDFTSLNVDSTEIDKSTFLTKLMTGNMVAFEIKRLQGKPIYKLYKLNIENKNIRSTIQQLASIEMKNYKMEGKQISKFNFTDLNGRNYTPFSTKGKIVVLKCWFIHCVACVQEFPDCNKLVDEYKNRSDVFFVSLASDTKKALQIFLKTKSFKYEVVPEMDDYIANKLNINMYPTHLLIDKTGKIIKVVNSIEELAPFLKKETEK